jgi:hypothetical protein
VPGSIRPEGRDQHDVDSFFWNGFKAHGFENTPTIWAQACHAFETRMPQANAGAVRPTKNLYDREYDLFAAPMEPFEERPDVDLSLDHVRPERVYGLGRFELRHLEQPLPDPCTPVRVVGRAQGAPSLP